MKLFQPSQANKVKTWRFSDDMFLLIYPKETKLPVITGYTIESENI